MSRTESFTLRVNNEERQILSVLANYLNRTKSDTIRLLLRAASQELQLCIPKPDIDGIAPVESGTSPCQRSFNNHS